MQQTPPYEEDVPPPYSANHRGGYYSTFEIISFDDDTDSTTSTLINWDEPARGGEGLDCVDLIVMAFVAAIIALITCFLYALRL
jgi:hypothetical protein